MIIFIFEYFNDCDIEVSSMNFYYHNFGVVATLEQLVIESEL